MISPYLPQTPPIYLPFTSIAVASLFDKPIFKSINICIFKIMFTCVKQEKWQNPGLGDRRSRGWWNMLKTDSTNIFPKYLCVLSVLRLTQLQFSRSVMSDSLQPHGWQHARLSCPSPTPRVYSWPLSWWCHPTISFFHEPTVTKSQLHS